MTLLYGLARHKFKSHWKKKKRKTEERKACKSYAMEAKAKARARTRRIRTSITPSLCPFPPSLR
jgi:hypothetical protein